MMCKLTPTIFSLPLQIMCLLLLHMSKPVFSWATLNLELKLQEVSSRFVMTSKHCKPLVPTMLVCITEMTLFVDSRGKADL
jgi:hypothetical protein